MPEALTISTLCVHQIVPLRIDQLNESFLPILGTIPSLFSKPA